MRAAIEEIALTFNFLGYLCIGFLKDNMPYKTDFGKARKKNSTTFCFFLAYLSRLAPNLRLASSKDE